MSITSAFRRFWQSKTQVSQRLKSRPLALESLEQRALLSAAPTAVATTIPTGTYVAGSVIPITVTFDQAVNVTGTPQLALNAGSTAVANYSGGSGTTALTFSYTVGKTDNTADLDYTSTSALALNGGTIEDASSNAASLTLPATGTDALAAQKITVAAVDGFETGDFSALPWQLSNFGTASNWSVESSSVHSGTFAAQSGAVSGASSSTLSVTLNVQAGQLSFWSKLSSASGTGSLIFEIDGTPQIQLSGTTGWQQSFVWVSAGQHTFSWIYGKNAADPSGSDFADLDDVQIVPGTTLIVSGSSSSDQFSFSAGSGGAYTVGLNGQNQSFTTEEFGTVLFAGDGGTATLTGSSSGGDTALLNSDGSGQLVNSTAGYVVSVSGVTDINAIGQAGDTAQLTDLSTGVFAEPAVSAGTANAIYYAYADYNSSGAPLAGMYGTGYSNSATGFGTNVGVSNGANDMALFFDSPGNDTFYSYADYNSTGQQLSGMYGSFGSGYTNAAKNFGSNVAIAGNGGSDLASFFDSTGSDTFYSYADYNSTSKQLAGMYSSSYTNSATGFGTNVAQSTSGGSDLAAFFDSTGDDTYYAYADYNATGQSLSGMYGSAGAGYTNSATGFSSMNGSSANGGADSATLVDSPGDDTLYTDLAIASLYGNDGSYVEQTSGFGTVNAYGVDGGVNTKGQGTPNYTLNYIGTWNSAVAGYSITANPTVLNAINDTAAGFTFNNAEVGATYDYSVTTSGGSGSVTGSGTVTSATQNVGGIDVSELSNGTLTFSVTLTDSNGTGPAATANATLDTIAPSGYTITPDHSVVDAAQATSAGFTFAGAEVGTTYTYDITSSGGGSAVSGTGSVTSATQDVTGIDVTSLSNGTLNYAVTLTDAAGNAGAVASATATLDSAAPVGYSITPDRSVINASQAASTGFTFAGAEVGTTYNYTVTSGGGGSTVTGSGTVTSATQDVIGINVSALPDGALTYSVTLRDNLGNTGAAVTGTSTLDTTAPNGYTITPNLSTINASQATATGFTFAGAEVGTNYNYSITSSGGGTAVTGSGSVTSATQDVTGANVTSLSDGTLTFSVTLTDAAGNVGAAATATATLDTAAQSANATLASTGTGAYAITLNNNGTTTIGTFWYAWLPNEDFMSGAQPTNVTAPAGWTASITGSGNGSDGYAIQWVATSSASYLQPGSSLSGFAFNSALTPAELTSADSQFYPSTPVGTSVTYTGAPFSSAADTFVVQTQPAPTGYTITSDQSTINASHASSIGFTLAGAEVGSTYNFTISSSGGGTAVTGSGSVTSATQDISGIDVSSLSDGTLTYSVTLTNSVGNTGTPATAGATLDRVAPSGYTITADQSTINANQATATGFTFAGAEVGATYSYSITSSGGVVTVIGNGTVTSATQDVTGVNVSSLPDGTLTFSVTLTDRSGNAGTAATANATLDTAAPTGYTITADQATIDASQATATGFTFAAATTGTTYNYSISSSGGGTAVTGSGTVTSATQDVTGINVSSLSDGTLNFSVTLTNSAGNVGAAATAAATLNTAAQSANATLASTGSGAYAITLNNTGTTTIGTFWYAWLPGEDFMSGAQPTNVTAPAGWTATITGSGNGSDGYAIQWAATSAASYLQPGSSLSGFAFNSALTSAELTSNDSQFYPSTPVGTSVTYIGAPFSSTADTFVVQAAG